MTKRESTLTQNPLEKTWGPWITSRLSQRRGCEYRHTLHYFLAVTSLNFNLLMARRFIRGTCFLFRLWFWLQGTSVAPCQRPKGRSPDPWFTPCGLMQKQTVHRNLNYFKIPASQSDLSSQPESANIADQWLQICFYYKVLYFFHACFLMDTNLTVAAHVCCSLVNNVQPVVLPEHHVSL